VDERGAMAVPEDVRTVGWYRFGSRPGSLSGSAVLSGHVGDRVQGRGVFAALGDVEPGDLVEVELTDGTRLGYRVRTVERVAKDALPADQLFARSGPPRLTLITCGGDFDWTTRTHTENVVVTAEPAR
jgi:LPXTG-site transpeptidase (sortase) family protein